ncbi:MAG: hypothetical protein IT285_13320 [Bdellovibrionales bacterium]|nr:hypothetical protein [Bdellovibrionales bacterium]
MKPSIARLALPAILLSGCGGVALPTELEGRWATGCVTYVSGNGASLDSDVLIQKNFARVSYRAYVSGDCTGEPESQGEHRHLLQIGEMDPRLEDPNRITLNLIQFHWTESSFMHTSWNGDAFIGTYLPEELGRLQRYTIFELVSSRELKIGYQVDAYDGLTPERRHVDFAPYTYVRSN